MRSRETWTFPFQVQLFQVAPRLVVVRGGTGSGGGGGLVGADIEQN